MASQLESLKAQVETFRHPSRGSGFNSKAAQFLVDIKSCQEKIAPKTDLSSEDKKTIEELGNRFRQIQGAVAAQSAIAKRPPPRPRQQPTLKLTEAPNSSDSVKKG